MGAENSETEEMVRREAEIIKEGVGNTDAVQAVIRDRLQEIDVFDNVINAKAIMLASIDDAIEWYANDIVVNRQRDNVAEYVNAYKMTCACMRVPLCKYAIKIFLSVNNSFKAGKIPANDVKAVFVNDVAITAALQLNPFMVERMAKESQSKNIDSHEGTERSPLLRDDAANQRSNSTYSSNRSGFHHHQRQRNQDRRKYDKQSNCCSLL